MSAIMNVNLTLAGINALLALVLAIIYARNHKEIGSPLTLGLFLFAAFLVLNNGTTIYLFVTMMATVSAQGEILMLIGSVLQLGALASLSWATMR